VWFLNLSMAYFGVTLILPFLGAFRALHSSWPFGLAMCKITFTLLYFTMFTSVLILVAISVDRCVLVLRPIWSHNHRSPRMASIVCAGLWLFSFIATLPHLVFRETCQSGKKTICFVSYSPLRALSASKDQHMGRTVQLTMETIQLLLSFVLPLLIITISYALIAIKISLRHLFRSNRHFKVIAMVVVSFFFYWAPYSAYSYVQAFHHGVVPDTMRHVLLLLATSFQCVNCCVTPIFYVAATQSYKHLLTKPFFSLFESAFKDDTDTVTFFGGGALQECACGAVRLALFFCFVYWVTFLLGMSGNSLIIWVTGFKMQKSPNTIWFLNLAAAYLIFTLTLPFFATYRAMGSHWPFGMALCKVLNTTLYFTMSTSIWLLVAISVDRCLLVLRPIWSHNRRTPRAAFAVSAAIWISTFIVTSPYLVFRQTHVDKDGRVTCYNNYAPSMDRNSSDDGTLLLGFVIPFFIITVSYVMLAVRISVKRLLKSSKPFKVIAMNITSFFVCWTPYHVLNYTLLNRKSFPETTLRALFFLASSLQCINCCFTPILYVFITEGYR
uniref:Probable G-protein coupled receptor 33 n=1 Tax=Latimeria chalumnae TaxID=7897 RepID=H3A240_LATCH